MALQDKLGSAEKLKRWSFGNIALALFTTAVQATCFETWDKLQSWKKKKGVFYTGKIVNTLKKHPFGEIFPVQSQEWVQNIVYQQ